jgi:hypothetical protein
MHGQFLPVLNLFGLRATGYIKITVMFITRVIGPGHTPGTGAMKADTGSIEEADGIGLPAIGIKNIVLHFIKIKA